MQILKYKYYIISLKLVWFFATTTLASTASTASNVTVEWVCWMQFRSEMCVNYCCAVAPQQIGSERSRHQFLYVRFALKTKMRPFKCSDDVTTSRNSMSAYARKQAGARL